MTNTPMILDRFWDRRAQGPFDDVIDVRSPGEFAEDHAPGAINLPVLSDGERAEVGTLYRHGGTFAARRLGAGLVARNIGLHLATHFADRPRDYRPLVYCWRGGQRSASFATVLAAVGWRVTVLKGGYKTYRAHVLSELDAQSPRFRYRLLAGLTGTAKTRLLHRLAARGTQILDLEELAGHRGSVLGAVGPQPSQKAFDSRLLAALFQLDPSSPVWLEAESHRIGNLYISKSLWAAMKVSGGVEVGMPFAERVEHLLNEYPHFVADPEMLKRELGRLRGGRLGKWIGLIDAGEWPALVADLLESHYDPGYSASLRRSFPEVSETAVLASANAADLDAMALELIRSSAEQCTRQELNL